MKASSSKSQETDFASPLSEQKQPLTELRFRFRASALKQSPSSDALLHDGEGGGLFGGRSVGEIRGASGTPHVSDA